MAAFALVWFILVPIGIASVVVASLPLRPTRLRFGVLAAHFLASIALIFSLGEPRALWVIVFGTGLVISATRIGILLTNAVRREGT
ncbi:hypothetical protein GCE86_24290 [Micromonospora terminaliae]|uniref:Uncharacterized protein n=1 Tax=Micromonospora terminaliae TaxID=1914461 RepID=A0AAJ2ZMR3_9ACTN|nr:hypothetical protein [Micromonospora terminaliae]NES31784.1 hypothetical protein [Micromonospora terminaliae]QGL49873.1 hypothetical protein GCE86_24290 [Micromonospora terminaliae]